MKLTFILLLFSVSCATIKTVRVNDTTQYIKVCSPIVEDAIKCRFGKKDRFCYDVLREHNETIKEITKQYSCDKYNTSLINKKCENITCVRK